MTQNLKDFSYFHQDVLQSDPVANLGRPYQQCSMSVMDTISDPNITFDENGVCNYYHEYKIDEKKFVFHGEVGLKLLNDKIKEIKSSSSGKKYDCILGLSGGVDSTYLCWMAKDLGLNPLIVHFDNGWNSELAVKNIENVINILGFDLYTYVVDWNEFKDMQLAYLKSSVVDIEVLTDQGFMAVLYEQARQHNIKYVLAGTNTVTEQVLPKYWIYSKGDTENLKDIQTKFGTIPVAKLKSYPFLNYSTRKYCEKVLKMSVVSPINYVEYKYDVVKDFITKNLGWKDYGGKHYESVWTRFYQGYILPKKYFIDKRKAHYSNLIFSGQISKEEALEMLAKPIYDEKLLVQDYEFVLKKLGLSNSEFETIMSTPRREHREFKTIQGYKDKYPFLKIVSKVLRRK